MTILWIAFLFCIVVCVISGCAAMLLCGSGWRAPARDAFADDMSDAFDDAFDGVSFEPCGPEDV